MANSPVHLLSSTQPAQSASENALTRVDDDLVNVRLTISVFFTSLKILLVVVLLAVVGA